MADYLAEQMRSLVSRLEELSNATQLTSESQKDDVTLTHDQISRVHNAIKDLSAEGKDKHSESYPIFYTAKTIAARAGKDITPKHVHAAVWNNDASKTIGGRIAKSQLKLKSSEPSQYRHVPANDSVVTSESKKDEMMPVELEGSVNAKQLADLLMLNNISLFSSGLKKLQQAEVDRLSRAEMTELAVAFANLLAADEEKTQKAMILLKRVSAKEEDSAV